MTASWISVIVLCVAVLRVADSLPVEGDFSSSLESSSNEDTGSLGSSSSDDSNQQEPGGGDFLNRDKRTIGVLRQVFPGLSQIVDRKIQMLTRIIFRFIGRLVLRGGAGGGGGTTGSTGDTGRKISITLPTFPPSEDGDEEDEDEEGNTSTTTEATDDSATTTTEASESENALAESKISEVKVRVTREAEKKDSTADQSADATGDNETDNDLDSGSSDDNESEGSDENPRNKRLLNLGGGGGGSGGGSGNFLFDIIRRTADGAARMAGTVFRVLAGTDDVGLPVYPPLPSAKQPRLLVAGSGTTQEKDEAENAPVDDGTGSIGTDLSTGKDDGYSAGVPGPLTRLFVIANRGIANLMQDLILRLAQTSERIVNFKARLITSII